MVRTWSFRMPEIKGTELVLDTAPVPRIAGDPLLLSQAVANLVENALKYGRGSREVTITVRRKANVVEIAVGDRGPGISDGEKPKVVQRFYRGDASRGSPGVGLGLSLVAAVARLHGGRLELCDNRPGLRAALVLVPVHAHLDPLLAAPVEEVVGA